MLKLNNGFSERISSAIQDAIYLSYLNLEEILKQQNKIRGISE